MRRRSPIALEVKHDRWLVSYSDFVTLLFAFFVVMYSISQVSEGKYRVLSNTLLEAFSVPESAINPIQVGDPSRSISPSAIDVEVPPQDNSADQSEGSANTDWLSIEEQVNQQFVDLIDDQLLTVNSNELWLELELNSNILFPTASADPSLQAKGIFEEIAGMFSSYNNPVQVEGFTDNVPINNRRFNSNWELSAARAASVVKLLARNGVSPERLSAVGRGEFQPIADNNSDDGRAKNRRVVVMISKQAAERPLVNSEEVDTIVGDDAVIEEVDNNFADANQDVQDSSNEIEQPQNSDPLIEPLQLNNGGLLFTNDPDLPRNNLSLPAEPEPSSTLDDPQSP